MSSSIEHHAGRRRSRHLAGRLALVICATSTTSKHNSGSSSNSHCEMTGGRIPALRELLPQVSAFVHPSSSAAVSHHRSRTINRRTVPLVLKDPTEVGDLTTDSGEGYPAESAHNSGPENSHAAYASPSNTPAGPAIDLEGPREHLNREFASDFVLNYNDGTNPAVEEALFWNSGSSSSSSSGPQSALEEDESASGPATAPVPVPDDDLDPYLAEHEAAEQLFIETVVREGENNIVRVEGIPPLHIATLDDDDNEKALSVNDDDAREADASASTTSPSTQSSSTQSYQIPTLSQIVNFALPATAIYLCDPLLSLIDTASVGLLARSTAHQAALSPAIAVVNYSALLLAFLFVGATNFVAQAAARVGSGGVGGAGGAVSTNNGVDADVDGVEGDSTASATAGPARILLSTLQISLHTGTLLGVLLFTLAPTLIGLLSGRGSLPPEVFQPAVQYVRIRALGFPAAAVLGSAQAACLGLKDTTTPLVVLGAAAVLNVVGDLSLVGVTSSKWLFGAAGAAWATTIGQFAAVGLFLRLLKARPRARVAVMEDNDDGAPSKQVGGSGRLSLMTRIFSRRRPSSTKAAAADMAADLPSGGRDADGAISARGFLAEHNFEPHHILRLPPKSTVKQFLPYVVPVTTTSVGRVSLFLSMAHVVSSCMGVVGMAAQTIALGIFDALCPLSQSLTLAAQAFVPGALEEQDRLRRAAKREAEASGTEQKQKSRDVLAKFSRQFLKAGGAFGLFTALCATSIPFVSGLMTTDAAVVSQISAVMPHLAAIFALHGLVMSAEGVLLGKEDVNFLGCMYGAFFFIMPAWMMRVKHGALNLGQTAGLGSVWSVFLMYQLMRSVLWAGRAAMPTKDR